VSESAKALKLAQNPFTLLNLIASLLACLKPKFRYREDFKLNDLKSFFCSSIGLKVLMSATGLAMCLFLLSHVLGNLVILFSPAAFNEYSYALTSNKAFLYLAEAGLISIVLLHILVAIKITRANRAARPVKYYMKKNTGKSRRWFASSYMMISGLFIVYFLYTHINEFKLGEEHTVVQNGVEMRDMAVNVLQEFKQVDDVIFYVIAMILIGLHLMHGFRSAFETLGVATSRWDKFFNCFSKLFVFAVMGGFIVIPLWILFVGVAR
jgi:succinate dehydrogenase / fumarate reductase cytochrome b subunit